MLNEITLFHLVREDIKIDIVARFENEVLVIDGYDTGKTVEAYYGRSDYEYTTTIPENGVDILYTHFGILNKDKGRRQQQLGRLPEMDVGGKHQENIFVVLAREHGVAAIDLARKQRHAFVLHGGAVQRAEFEMDEVRRLQQLRQRDLAVVSTSKVR